MPATKYITGERRNWRGEEFKGFKPTVYDWCRLAAFIDGEGHVQVNPYNRASEGIMQCRIQIGNTNPALLKWLKEVFGGNVICLNRGNPKWKPQYVWSCTAGHACWCLTNSLPWMLLKIEQAKLLIQLQDNIDQTRQGRGRRLTQEQADYRILVKSEINFLNKRGPQE